MSAHEKAKCPECEKQRAILLTELFPENLPNENEEWTIQQLQHFKKSIESRKQSQESIAKSSIGQIGNSLLGRRGNDTGQPNTVTPSATIGNSLFNLTAAEVLAKQIKERSLNP